MALGDPAIVCLITIQAAGLISAFAARRAEGSSGQTPVYCAFYLCVVLVSAAAFASSAIGSGFCITSGATLAAMALAATWDMRASRKPEGL
jgi:hypothetical protein